MISTRTLVTPLVAALILAGCSAASRLESALGTKYRFSYVLTSPNPAGKRTYLDERIKIQFLIDDGAIRFKLTNLSPEKMTIDWSKASIGVAGRYFTVRNSRSYYSQDVQTASLPSVAPKGYMIDLAIPAQNIIYDGKQWQERDLLPTTDRHSEAMRNRILASKGKTIDLLLPIEFERSGPSMYTFTFAVASVTEIPWERYRKPHRPLPPKPVNPVKLTTNDQILTAAIVVGVVGISAILLSQRKAPPTE